MTEEQIGKNVEHVKAEIVQAAGAAGRDSTRERNLFCYSFFRSSPLLLEAFEREESV